jgi:hypothetical protein
MIMNDIKFELVTEFKIKSPYYLDIISAPGSHNIQIILMYRSPVGVGKHIYINHVVSGELSTHKGHLYTVTKSMINRLETRIGTTERFFRGLLHITKHIGGHPLHGEIFF